MIECLRKTVSKTVCLSPLSDMAVLSILPVVDLSSTEPSSIINTLKGGGLKILKVVISRRSNPVTSMDQD